MFRLQQGGFIFSFSILNHNVDLGIVEEIEMELMGYPIPTTLVFGLRYVYPSKKIKQL